MDEYHAPYLWASGGLVMLTCTCGWEMVRPPDILDGDQHLGWPVKDVVAFTNSHLTAALT